MPTILQSDNRGEYKNKLIKDFCEKIKLNISLVPPPSVNKSVVEISQKEIRKKIYIYYSESPINFNLKNVSLEIVQNQNNNIHTITDYRPMDLFYNTGLEVYNKVVENI